MFFSSCSSFGNFTLLFSSTTAQNCQKLPSAAVVLRSAIVLFCFVLSACKIGCPLFCLPNDDDDDDDDGRRNARWGEVRIQWCVEADTVDSNSTDRRVGAQQANELENRQADSNEPHHHHHHQPLLLVLVIAAKVGKSGKNKNEKNWKKGAPPANEMKHIHTCRQDRNNGSWGWWWWWRDAHAYAVFLPMRCEMRRGEREQLQTWVSMENSQLTAVKSVSRLTDCPVIATFYYYCLLLLLITTIFSWFFLFCWAVVAKWKTKKM